MLTFHPPSYRAASGDLTVQVSPLGLVELADEEFEIHGPRLSRYALYWAHYLGHMQSHMREIGEPQFSFNYVRALSDYITSFTLGRGVGFRCPAATQSIILPALNRVWEQDNDKDSVLWEIGVHGGVTGDMFAKIAYEDPFVDPAGRLHPGRVRIIPLNAAQCFPQWHPHDRSRMVSFKLKYRFWNTAPTGERQVYTYTELITDVGIEEYINDRLIDSRPNPLGVIPIAYEPNIRVPGSPWGLPDIDSVIPLNRELNEKALEVSDIINYHAAPLTVVVGAKLANIEKGASRVITLPKEASMTNLQGLVELNGPLAYMDYIKRAMHEMTGVPESALGQMQPISNTSGVALHIQYQPLMNRYDRKTTNLSRLFRKINELIILTLAQKEPAVLQYDPMESARPDPQHPLVLDPADPNTYETAIHWPPPLPVDILVKLNEIQAKMGLGLESKEGALRDLGEDMPREKLDEIAAEQVEDAKEAGALSMLTSAIASAVQLVTGINPNDPEGGVVPPDDGGGVKSTAAQGPSLPGPMVTPEIQAMACRPRRARLRGQAGPVPQPREHQD